MSTPSLSATISAVRRVRSRSEENTSTEASAGSRPANASAICPACARPRSVRSESNHPPTSPSTWWVASGCVTTYTFRTRPPQMSITETEDRPHYTPRLLYLRVDDRALFVDLGVLWLP